jgi:signal transduction histidine kinase/DNA-binding response OmpR family regulator
LALAGIIAVAIAMAALYRHVAVDNFRELRTEQHEQLARSLSVALVDDVVRLRALALTSSWPELQASDEVARLAATIESDLEYYPIYAVNIFAPDGLMLYSTAEQRIGAKMLMNAGVEMAASGQEVSAIVRRDTFNRFDRIVEDRDMIETYIPMRNEQDDVVGVFEIHSDITDFFVRVDKTQQTIVLGVGGSMLFLYLLLVGYFWRSDRKLFNGVAAGRRGLLRNNDADLVSRAKSDFVATISHEIRTPLNAVLGMTDLLNLTSLTRKQREYIQTVQTSGDMLISLVDNLLDFSQLESGTLELHKTEFDVMDLLERVLHIMGHSAYSKGVELVGDFAHDLDLRIAADKRRLQQILINVVNNAIKFTERGEVVFRTSAAALGDGRMELQFVVSDTGVGIDESVREKLFTPFASSIRTASGQLYGSGLGLTICKQLLDTMGGDIELASREKGGTVVTIRVPVERVESAEAPVPAERPANWPGRVLSMQANRAAADSIAALLETWDIRCETAFEVDEGIHRLRVAASGGKPFDCVIVDSAMTPSDRLLVARRIRKTAEIEKLPIVLLTPISETLGVGEVSALGGIRCINKPLLPLELRYNLLRSVQQEAAAAKADTGREELSDHHSDIRILIAEDNPVSSGVLQSMLSSEGYGADVVEDGPGVLDALQEHRYDLLLLDCQMPGMDGDVVTRKIEERPDIYGAKPVIVAVTADTTEAHREQCITAGMDDFVPKPVRLEGLRAGLNRWMPLIAERSASKDEFALNTLRENLVEKTGNGDDLFLSGYIDLFLRDAEERLQVMSTAFVSGDSEALRRAGHALKGSCLELGADRMARYCDDLSVAARNQNLDEVGTVIGKLDQEFARLRPVYESVQASSTNPS